MTSPMHASTGPGTEVASVILPLVSCCFARHANIARVCDTPRCDPVRHEHPMQAFAMTRHRKHRLGAMPYLVGFAVSASFDQQLSRRHESEEINAGILVKGGGCDHPGR